MKSRVLIKTALSPDTKIPSDGLTSKIITEMAKYEIQYLDVLNKMNLDPDDLAKVFKRWRCPLANQKAILKYQFENLFKPMCQKCLSKH